MSHFGHIKQQQPFQQLSKGETEKVHKRTIKKEENNWDCDRSNDKCKGVMHAPSQVKISSCDKILFSCVLVTLSNNQSALFQAT